MRKITVLINKIVRHTKWYNDEYWQGVTKFWGRLPFNTDIVNLGSGAALHAFNYEGLSIVGQNWALSPQSLVHDYNILRNYFSYLREGATVIITICPFSCLFSQYDKKHNLKYYTILHPATIIDFEEEERTRAMLIRQNPFKQMPIYCIKKTTKEFLTLIKRKVKTIIQKKEVVNFQISAENIINGWKKQFGISDLNDSLTTKHSSEQNARKKTLNEIVCFCKERSLNPIIVIPPMHKSLTSRFPEAFIENYLNSFLKGINVPVYNHINSFSDDRYFDTALFLNKNGAKEFTKIIYKTSIRQEI